MQQMAEAPESAEWLLRAMVRRADGEIVGYINFHGPPDEAGRAELGYTVFEPHRRQGYATEAALAMMRWAHEAHGVSTFVVSISPANEPSLRLADAMGFLRTGTQIDEIDGEEWVFELQWDLAGRNGRSNSRERTLSFRAIREKARNLANRTNSRWRPRSGTRRGRAHGRFILRQAQDERDCRDI